MKGESAAVIAMMRIPVLPPGSDEVSRRRNGVVLKLDVDGLMQSVKLNAAPGRQPLPDDATLPPSWALIMDPNHPADGAKRSKLDERLDQAIANASRKQNNMTLDQMRRRSTMI